MCGCILWEKVHRTADKSAETVCAALLTVVQRAQLGPRLRFIVTDGENAMKAGVEAFNNNYPTKVQWIRCALGAIFCT